MSIGVHLWFQLLFLGSRDALGEVSVRVIYFEEIAGSDGDAVGENQDVDAAGAFRRGIFDPGDTTGILGQPPQQLRWWLRCSRPSAGHFLGCGAKDGQRGWVGQI